MVDEAYQVMLYIPFMLFDYLNIPNFAFVSIYRLNENDFCILTSDSLLLALACYILRRLQVKN